MAMNVEVHPNGCSISLCCSFCGTHYDLHDYEAEVVYEGGEQLVCPDCLVATESRGAVGLASRVMIRAAEYRRLAEVYEKLADAISDESATVDWSHADGHTWDDDAQEDTRDVRCKYLGVRGTQFSSAVTHMQSCPACQERKRERDEAPFRF